MSNPVTAEEILAAIPESLAEDVLMALKYLYAVEAKPAVPDSVFDTAEREFMQRPETDEFETPVAAVTSDNGAHYSLKARLLASYIKAALIDKFAKNAPKAKSGS